MRDEHRGFESIVEPRRAQTLLPNKITQHAHAETSSHRERDGSSASHGHLLNPSSCGTCGNGEARLCIDILKGEGAETTLLARLEEVQIEPEKMLECISGNSIQSRRPECSEIANIYQPHTRRAVIADAVQPVCELLARSPHTLLATVQSLPDQDDKDAGRKCERKEDQPRIGALCHRATNGDSVCRRYNPPRRVNVLGANCFGRVRHVDEEERNALEFRKSRF
jgi:hypothetical protein